MRLVPARGRRGVFDGGRSGSRPRTATSWRPAATRGRVLRALGLRRTCAGTRSTRSTSPATRCGTTSPTPLCCPRGRRAGEAEPGVERARILAELDAGFAVVDTHSPRQVLLLDARGSAPPRHARGRRLGSRVTGDDRADAGARSSGVGRPRAALRPTLVWLALTSRRARLATSAADRASAVHARLQREAR